jgi:hypothetical protein
MKITYEEERRVIHIIEGNYGVVYLIIKEEIHLARSFPFEANDDGRCIGFEVPEDLDLTVFDNELRRFIEGKGFTVVGERK